MTCNRTPYQKEQIRQMMLSYGGGFVKALATAYGKADFENQRKIEETWPELFDQYEKFVKYGEIVERLDQTVNLVNQSVEKKDA